MQTIVILMCQQITPNSFENKITKKLLTYKSYEQPFNCVQTDEALARLKMLSTNYVFTNQI